MNILLYSSVFYPSIGGIETVSETLADNFARLGENITVVTETASTGNKLFSYPVVRQPSFRKRIALIRQADIVYSNGASVALFFYAKLLGKPFVWTHGGYQLTCIDGLGWDNGTASPLSPKASVRYYLKKKGLLFTLKEAAKLYVRRIIGSMVHKNIAATQWIAYRQPLKKQVVIYNPFPLSRFKNAVVTTSDKYDFLYVGRLVSEKGVATLLKAFKLLTDIENYRQKTLLIVGDGTWRNQLESLAASLQIDNRVKFVGRQTGDELLSYISKAEIAIVPSEWEEPMGGVALELMAAGKVLIVSKNGGLAECIGDAGLTFENGNEDSLLECMRQLSDDADLKAELRRKSIRQLTKFDETELTKQYISVFKELISV